jgi:hypothetical protein
VAHFFVVVSGSKIHERAAHFFIDIYIDGFAHLDYVDINEFYAWENDIE